MASNGEAIHRSRLILRSPRSGRLEGRIMLMQPAAPVKPTARIAGEVAPVARNSR
jgi:hypothetical protein